MSNRDDVVAGGLTETQALRQLLGEDGLTNDREADLLRAAEVIKAQQSETALRYKVVLHGLHAELGTWLAVAEATGIPKTTVYSWAHSTEQL